MGFFLGLRACVDSKRLSSDLRLLCFPIELSMTDPYTTAQLSTLAPPFPRCDLALVTALLLGEGRCVRTLMGISALPRHAELRKRCRPGLLALPVQVPFAQEYRVALTVTATTSAERKQISELSWSTSPRRKTSEFSWSTSP